MNGTVSEPVSLETRVHRNANDIEAIYGLIHEFDGRTTTNFAKVNQRLDNLEGKVNSLDGKVNSLDGKVDIVVGHLGDLQGKVDSINQRFDDLEGKVDNIVGQLGDVVDLLRKQH
jgi:tetrahydromethanopterin S-methyltransferase subunit G